MLHLISNLSLLVSWHRVHFIFLVLLTAFGFSSASADPKNYTQDEPAIPYKPYRSRNTQLRGNRLLPGRIVNEDIEQVKSCGLCCFENPTSIQSSGFMSTPYRSDLELGGFYGKVLNVGGVPVAASNSVSDAAVLETALTLVKLASKHPILLTTLRDEGVHFATIGRNEKLTDNPHYSALNPADWNWARGVGATRWIPTSSCAEENLLCLHDDPYFDENICVHEHSHTIEGSGKKLPTPRWIHGENLDDLLLDLYRDAIEKKIWTNTYAALNQEEMWAEGVQSFYSVNTRGPRNGDGIHNDVWNRESLKQHHPELFQLVEQVFASDVDFSCPTTRLEDCDCEATQQVCARAGIELRQGITNPPISTAPTKLPTPPPIDETPPSTGPAPWVPKPPQECLGEPCDPEDRNACGCRWGLACRQRNLLGPFVCSQASRTEKNRLSAAEGMGGAAGRYRSARTSRDGDGGGDRE